MVETFFKQVLELFAEEAVYYFLVTLPFFVVFWIVGQKYFASRRIQPEKRADGRQFRDEILISMGFLVLYAVVDVLLLKSSTNPIESDPAFKIYTDVSEHGGPLYAVFTCFMLFVIDDTWFYWMHRTVHHPVLYKYIHRVHHQSIDTTPFTAYRFHPVEGLLEIVPTFLAVLYASLFPVHIGALVVWQTGSFLFNVIGHSGYEIYPASWNDYWFLKWKTPSTHHNMHHERFNGNYGLYFIWWDRLMGTEFKDYESRYRALFTRHKAQAETAETDSFKPLRVAAVRPEAHDCVSIYFDQYPDEFDHYQPGQYLTFRIMIEGQAHLRTFSLSSAPGLDKQLRITVRPVGVVTRFLATQLKPGEWLDARRPAGTFVVEADPSARRQLMMVAGGSGVTPIYAMLKFLLVNEPDTQLTLLLVNRSGDQVVLGRDLDELVSRFPKQFRLLHHFSGSEGRLTTAKLRAIFAGASADAYYLCGPLGLMTLVRQTLTDLDVDARNVHWESFGALPAGVANTQPAADVVATMRLQLGDTTHQVGVQHGETLLAAALRQGVAAPYSCRSGSCGTCQARCLAGGVHLNESQTYLSDEAIRAGRILLCQSTPTTPEVTVAV